MYLLFFIHITVLTYFAACDSKLYMVNKDSEILLCAFIKLIRKYFYCSLPTLDKSIFNYTGCSVNTEPDCCSLILNETSCILYNFQIPSLILRYFVFYL